MSDERPVETRNAISGGTFYGPVLQGRDIKATFRLPPAAPVALAQLPPELPGFTGRDAELAVLAGLLDAAGAAGPIVVSAVAGLAGVGKTTLAIRAAHAARARGWFGGGVLFINLHGYDEAPVQPAQALDALLRALGVPAEHIPPDAEERAGLYRSTLAQVTEPVLVIADNASSEAQVRPLLPGSGPHKVIVTSRHTLAALGARLVDVTVLTQETAVGLLDAVLRVARPGDDRISGDPAAAVRLAVMCDGLPLALQIAAALLIADPALATAGLAKELDAERTRLERLSYDDGSSGAVSVAAAFELSYRRLEATTARLFRLLAVNPGPDVSTAATAALAALPATEARRILGELARAHLVEPAPGGSDRWRMHDLLRLYAQQLSHARTRRGRRPFRSRRDEAAQSRDRLLGYYLRMAEAADAHLRALPGMTVPGEFAGRDAALAWLDAERPSLVAAVTMAADTGRDQAALQLPLFLSVYFERRRRFDDWLATAVIGVSAARRFGDRHAEGAALTSFGNALMSSRRFEEATRALQDAAVIHEEIGDHYNHAMALTSLGGALTNLGQLEEAVTTSRSALAILRRIGRQTGGKALSNLGTVLQQMGRFEDAITAHQDAVASFRKAGDRHSEGKVLLGLGVDLAAVERLEEATTALQQAAGLCRETGDRHSEGGALGALGLVLAQLQRFEEAITALQDAAAIFRETGDQRYEGITLDNLKAVRAERQALADAADTEHVLREQE